MDVGPLRRYESSKLRYVWDEHDPVHSLPTSDRRLSDLRKAGAPLGRLSYSYCHHLPGLWGLIAPLRITRASRSAPSVEARIRRRIGPAKAGIRSPTSFGVEGDDAEELTSSVGSSCHSKLPGLGSTRGVNLIPLGGVRATALALGIGLPPVSGFSRNLPGLNEWAKNVSLALSSSASCQSKLRLEYSS
ncbi:hypothetical protein MTO96_032954 [Rhipicephalus appendiculatus]